MPREDVTSVDIRPYDRSDHKSVLALIEPHVRYRKILRRTLDELDELLPNSFVAEGGGRVVAYAALEIYSRKLAEIRSLVVEPQYQGKGLGKRMVAACVQRAHDRNVFEVMAISSAEEFFRGCGFDFTLPDEKKAFFRRTRDEH